MKIKINLCIFRALWQTNKGLYFLKARGAEPNTISPLYTTWDIDPCPFRIKKDTLFHNSWQNTHKSPDLVEEEVLVILQLHVPTTIAVSFTLGLSTALLCTNCILFLSQTKLWSADAIHGDLKKTFPKINIWTTGVCKSWQSAHNSDRSGKRCTMPFPIQSAHS